MENKLQKLESLRGFAAVYVIFHHLFNAKCIVFNHDISFLFKFGQEAVMLFFILSGFVIHYSFQRSTDKSFRTFFKKRFLRIYIPLIIVFTVSYIIYLIFSKPSLISMTPHLLGNLFMLQDVSYMKPNVITEPFLGNDPLWSLSYEWWFYMIYFIIDRYFKNDSFKVAALLSICGAITYSIYPFFISKIFMYLIIWWSGVEIAKLYAKKEVINIKNLRKVLFVLMACTGILFFNFLVRYTELQFSRSPALEIRHMALASVILIMALVWKRYNWFFFNKTIGLFTIFAPISFCIYISHYFLVIRPDYLNFIDNKPLKITIGIIICLLFSFIVEQKIYPYINKKFKRV